ncbi:MAG: glycoside hydrolase family 13 protein [Rhodothermales bacterium]
MTYRLFLVFVLVGGGLSGCTADTTDVQHPASEEGAAWVRDAVFYQIFPERFRNGDASNDPTRASLEYPPALPDASASWHLSPWTGDWYARADWEQEMGDDFYESYAVFHRRYGGDLQGVIDKLDYLKDLGVNTLYFNPIFYARSMHKYDGNSYHHIDPYFGPDPEGDFALMGQETSDPATWYWTEADKVFLRLLEEAHARGLRVVIDGVWNHTGRDFFAFADLRDNQEASPYKDWYIVRQYDDPATPENEFDYKGWWGFKPLPEFADTPDSTDLHPGPKQYVFDATARWMDPNSDGDPSDGIDGWRLDVANEVPIRFWADWNAHVRSLNPNAYTVSEIWDDASTFLEEGGFSATMNYHGFAFPVKGFLIDNTLSPSGFVTMLDERRAEYAEDIRYMLQNLIDSHDTDRVASMIVNAGRQPYLEPHLFDYDRGPRVSPRNTDLYDVRAPNERERHIQRLVALFQMTYVGAPMIYYGTEAGMWGADDPDDRMPMVWDDLTYDDQVADPLGRPREADPVAFDSEVFRFYQRVIQLRHEHAALRHGSFDVLAAADEHTALVFSRTLEDETVVVALNRSDEVQRLGVQVDGTFEMVFSTRAEGASAHREADALLLELPALTGVVLRRTAGGSSQ